MKRYTSIIIACVSLVFTIAPKVSVAAYASPPETPGLMISEVQTGALDGEGQEVQHQEFIEIYNAADEPLLLDNLRLEYLSASHTGIGEPTRVLAVLSGSLKPRHFYLVSSQSYLVGADAAFAASSTNGFLARTGGHVRMTDSDSTIDLLSWGTATPIASWWRSTFLPPGTSIERVLPGEADYTDGRAFRPPSVHISPMSGPRPDNPGPETPDDDSQSICKDIVLSEILSNGRGTDTGKEFIEVYNAGTSPVSLEGCSLHVDAKSFSLPVEQLPPQSYRAFYDSESSLALPNTVAQPVMLRTETGDESVVYGDNLPEDVSWALFGEAWQKSTVPTPGLPNVLAAQEPTNSQKPQTVADCGPGKERNPETNRCRSMAGLTASATCKVGQERNPHTNRCRALASSEPAKAQCKSGQERNPETNRCRSIAAASTAKACPPGQERNPETNRCRKINSSSPDTLAAVHDVMSQPVTSNLRWWVTGFTALVVAGYAIYEWRRDVARAVVTTWRKRFLGLLKWIFRRPTGKPT